MLLLHRLMLRWHAWRLRRAVPVHHGVPLIVPVSPPIYREVTSSGVRVFSLCGGCGQRLGQSATLCEGCASRRTSAPPF